MDIVLCKPKAEFLFDAELVKYWLWANKITSWKDIEIKYNDFHNFYDVSVNYEIAWKVRLGKQLSTMSCITNINFIRGTNSVRFFIKV